MKEAVKTYWDDEGNCYVTESEDFENVIGCGGTEEESKKIFKEHLERFLDAKRQNRVVKAGRPCKDNERLNCHIPAEVREFIDIKCKEKQIKQGQFIAELVKCYKEHC